MMCSSFCIGRSFLRNKKLKEVMGEKMFVYLYLFFNSFLEDDKFVVNISVEKISRELGITKEKILKNLYLLESLGVIKPTTVEGKYCIGERQKTEKSYRSIFYLTHIDKTLSIQEEDKDIIVTVSDEEIDSFISDEEIDSFINEFRKRFKEHYGIIYKKGGFNKRERTEVQRFLRKAKSKGIDIMEYIEYFFKNIFPSFKKENDVVTHYILFSNKIIDTFLHYKEWKSSKIERVMSKDILSPDLVVINGKNGEGDV